MDLPTQALVARTAAKEALRQLVPLTTNVGTIERFRKKLEHVRDRLHAACRLFEQTDADFLNEAIYIPLFDALSLITETLSHRPMRRTPVARAMCCLDQLV